MAKTALKVSKAFAAQKPKNVSNEYLADTHLNP